MTNDMIDDLCTKIKEGMKNLPPEPQYEEIVMDDGFACMIFVKPKFMLKDLGYDYTTYNPKELITILKTVTNELNDFYGDSGIYVKCNLPNKIVQDFVFEVSMP